MLLFLIIGLFGFFVGILIDEVATDAPKQERDKRRGRIVAIIWSRFPSEFG